MQNVLLAALEMSLENAPKGDPQTRQWLSMVLDAADTGPWRKRAQQALQAGDWKAFEQIVEDALAARQPPAALLRIAAKIPVPSLPRLQALRRIRMAYPGDFWANHDLAGLLHYHYSQPEEGIRYYTGALTLRPHNPGVCVNLGNALREIGDLDGAIAAYREALDGHPDYAGARARLVRTLENKGDMNGALAELRAGIRFGNHANDYLFLGDALFRRERRDKAIECYKKAITLEPKNPAAHYNLGTALLEKNECREEAIDSFRTAIVCYRRETELNPDNGYSRNGLAWFLVTCPYVPLRDPVEGMQQAQKAVELLPNYGNGWNTLGVAHYFAGNWKEAIAALEKVIQLKRGNSYDWFFLAMAYWQRGDKEKARRCFDQAVLWMDKYMPKDKELGRFRAEGAELLMIEAIKK
jgi:tetratricopeptide (TPR) repeat protein